MAKEQYGIIEPKSEFPPRSLLVVPHQGNALTLGFPTFGPNYFSKNIEQMSKTYSHPITGEKTTFRTPRTSESISAAAYKFGEMAKTQIFDPKWLQMGWIVRTSEGVFTNTQETDGKVLKGMLNNVKKQNGIYLINNQVAFAPYESFQTGVQYSGDFAQGGLARALEHSKEKSARSLGEISSKKFYPNGVNVFNFDKTRDPHSSVAGLGFQHRQRVVRLRRLGRQRRL